MTVLDDGDTNPMHMGYGLAMTRHPARRRRVSGQSRLREKAVRGLARGCAAVLGLILLGVLVAAPAVPAEVGQDIFGTWSRGTVEEYPWVKGVFVGIRWDRLEPEPGQFDWDFFDNKLAECADAGKYMQLIVMVGPMSPRWIYDHGVPEVHTTPTINPRGEPHGGYDSPWTYPFYLDEDYKRYYHRLIREVADHIDTLPTGVRKMLVSVQTAEGTTGDEGGYKGKPLDKRYVMPREKWDAFKFETWRLFDRLYRPKKPKIHLLINSGNRGQYNDWLLDNIPDVWRKAGNPGHGYQLNNERMMMAFLDPLINHPDKNGNFIRCRSEMDEEHKGWFREAPVWNMYWLNLWALHFGLDIFQHKSVSLRDERLHEGFIFMSKYGGHKDPSKSPGAWCALRDGLDAADVERFPIERFGAGAFEPNARDQTQGIARCLKIVEAFSQYGARQGDPDKAMRRVMKNRDAKAMNDVGWNIEAGNYQRYLTQIDPDGTSRGYWRVGPKDQPYGRFARGFDVATDRNVMYFDVDDRFFGGGPHDGSYPLKVRVVYFDRGRGSWTVKYDAVGEKDKTAVAVVNTDTKRWKEVVVTLDDARFGGRCQRGADLVLVNTSDENTLFHMIEVTR